MALPAGFPPASFRLEGGCLMCSATTAFEIGQRGRICTCGHPVPSRACCCYTTRCLPRCARCTPGTYFMGNAGPTHLEPVSRGEIRKIGGPEGSCTLGGKAYEASLCALVKFPAIENFWGLLRIPIKGVT